MIHGNVKVIDWALARERNREALLRVLALLFSMAGVVNGAAVAVLPRHIHSAVLRVLRPAESALRRLIVIEARDLRVAPPAPPVERVGPAKIRGARGHDVRACGFAIIEPLQKVGFAKPPVPKGQGPRISFFDGFDPVRETPSVPLPDDPVDATRLCGRLMAARRALDSLPKQALRLARWQARRDAGMLKSPRTRALRPGRPPGHRARHKHPVDQLLSDCHALALYTNYTRAPPDPSGL